MAGGGGAWKVAYADFVTAMMAFFLVMWLVGQSDQVKEAVADEFSQPLFGWTEAKGTHDPQMVNDLQRKSIATQRPPEKISDGPRTKKRRFDDINTSILFAEGSSELDGNARKALQRLVPHLAGKLQKIEIRGHDSRPRGGEGPSAWDLCYARCLATLKFLEEQGIASDRIRISLAGGNEPRTGPDILPAANSRVEVLLLSEFTRQAGDRATP
jgi:chemotaxis protein MotB